MPLENEDSICLPDNNFVLMNGTECFITGWGLTSWEGKQPDLLHEAKVSVVTLGECNKEFAYNFTITDRNICAGYEEGGRDACYKDSGGSMACKQHGTWYSEGIVSSGFECARRGAYGIYTNVDALKEWVIESILKMQDAVLQTYENHVIFDVF